MWQETTARPRNLKIWQDELDSFVPPRVLDFHVHLFNRATLPPSQRYDCAGHPIEQYGIEQLAGDLAAAYPGRETSAVCFGMPHAEYSLPENNRYVAAACDGKRFFPFRLLDPAEPPDAVRDDIIRSRFLGLKPYLNYVRKPDPNDVQIAEMLPDPIMRIADELGLIVMLHIPRTGRLADPLNREQVLRLCRQFPRARVVLAHIGRAYYLSGIVGHLEPFIDQANCYIDLAMLNNHDVLEYAFEVFPPDRILYGTDIPIALAPGKSVEINDQYTYVTPVPWKLSISDDHRKLRFTSFLYEELRAIRRAAERAGATRQFIEDLFYNNGISLLNSAMAAAGGPA